MVEAGSVILDPIRHAVRRGEQSIDLTRQEFILLNCLMRSAGRCVTRQALTECVWSDSHAVGSTALDVLVNALRTKIDSPFRHKLIGTVRGSGYIFKPEPTA